MSNACATPERGALYGLLARFDSPAAVSAAADGVRSAGYSRWDVYSPFPIHGIERAMGVRSTRLPWVVLICGLSGAALALFFQWWTNAVDYPFKISGKPLFGIPANIPVTFEFTILLAAFGAFFGMLIFNGLPHHHHPLFESERFARTSDDGFFIAVEAADALFDLERTGALLESLGGKDLEPCHQGPGSGALPRTLKIAGIIAAAAALIPLALIVRGRYAPSIEPRFHVVPDMDFQTRYRAQAANPFFADGRAMRLDPEGTVARGELRADDHLQRGTISGEWATTFPMELSREVLERGRQRFAIFCAPCHGESGYGDGIVARRADALQEGTWVPPSSLHDLTVRKRTVGQIFDTIRKGVRNMPAYGPQMPVEDSWAIVAYVRALQRAQNAAIEDVPADRRAALGIK